MLRWGANLDWAEPLNVILNVLGRHVAYCRLLGGTGGIDFLLQDMSLDVGLATDVAAKLALLHNFVAHKVRTLGGWSYVVCRL